MISGNRPLHEKSCRRCREVSRHMDESTQCIKYEPKRKVRRGSEKRDQETSEASRSNQNMDSICRNQRQIDSHGKTKTDRDGKLGFEISGLD